LQLFALGFMTSKQLCFLH